MDFTSSGVLAGLFTPLARLKNIGIHSSQDHLTLEYVWTMRNLVGRSRVRVLSPTSPLRTFMIICSDPVSLPAIQSIPTTTFRRFPFRFRRFDLNQDHVAKITQTKNDVGNFEFVVSIDTSVFTFASTLAMGLEDL